MEIFRYSSNAYGQSTLEGVSFDLIYVIVGITAVIITAHFCYKLFSNKD